MNKLTKVVTRLGTLFLSIAATLVLSSSFSYFDKVILVSNKVASATQKLEIYTISLDNAGHGDCSIVKFGDTEVLIDAGGSVKNSKDRIYNALKHIVKDNVIEYAIMSHGDDDHIANFLPGESLVEKGGLAKWLLEGENYINVFIDFDISADTSIKSYPHRDQVVNFKDEKGLPKSGYKEQRELFKTGNRIRHHLASSMCVRNHRELSGSDIETFREYARFSDEKYITDTFYLEYKPKNPAFSSLPIEDEFNTEDTGCSLKILYNYYYDHPISKDSERTIESVDHNVISVCSLITLETSSGDPIKALFTGDLEEYDSAKKYTKTPAEGSEITGGESLLYEYNKDDLSTPITYYKAAHHGSDTSNSPKFLEKIRPTNVVISGCAGGDYGLPGTDLSKGSDRFDNSAIGELSYYTDHIYITDKIEVDDKGNKTVVPYYGDIHFTAQSNGVTNFEFLNPPKSTSDEVKPIDISQSAFFTDWMKENRFYNLRVFNLSNQANVAVNCTYIKIGSIDILIGAGAESSTKANLNISDIAKKVDYLCNDHVLDYLIVPSANQSDWLFLLGKNKSETYVLQNTDIKSVNNFIYYSSNSINNEDYIAFIERIKKSSVASNMKSFTPTDIKKNIKIGNQIKYGMYLDFDGQVHNDYYLEFLTHNGAIITDNGIPTDKSTASLYTLLRCGSYQYLNLGSDYNCGYSSDGQTNYLLNNNPEIESSIHLLQYPYFGYYPTAMAGSNLPITRFHNETNSTSGGIGDEARKIGGYIFLNTYFGEKADGLIKHPSSATAVLGALQQTIYTTKGYGQYGATPIDGDIYQRISLNNDKIFLYRTKKTGALSFDDFSFYDEDAINRSQVGKYHYARTIDTNRVKDFL